MDHRFVDPGDQPEDQGLDPSLRPERLDQMLGQDKVKKQLGIAIAAARERGEALDHVLLSGPPGLGKTTLARVIANEMDVGVHATSGPLLNRPVDLAGIVTASAPGTCSSSTRSIGSTAKSRSTSTPPWRTTASTSSSTRAPRGGR